MIGSRNHLRVSEDESDTPLPKNKMSLGAPPLEEYQARFTTSLCRFAKKPERLLYYLGHPSRPAGKKIQVAKIYRPDPRFSHWQSRGLENGFAAAQRRLPDHLKRNQLSIRRRGSDRRSKGH